MRVRDVHSRRVVCSSSWARMQRGNAHQSNDCAVRVPADQQWGIPWSVAFASVCQAARTGKQGFRLEPPSLQLPVFSAIASALCSTIGVANPQHPPPSSRRPALFRYSENRPQICRLTRPSCHPETDAPEAGPRDQTRNIADLCLLNFVASLSYATLAHFRASPCFTNHHEPYNGIPETTKLWLCGAAPCFHGPCPGGGPAARLISAIRRRLGRHSLRSSQCQNRLLYRYLSLSLDRPARRIRH